MAGAYRIRRDAELAQTSLTAAGIRSVIEADDAGGAYHDVVDLHARPSADDSESAP